MSVYKPLLDKSEPVDINLKGFDMSLMTTFQPVILCCGARGSGKSTLVKDILYHHHAAGAPRIVIFSDTESVNGFFSEFIPGICIHSPVTIEGIKNVWEKQKDIAMKKRLKQIPETTDTRLIIVADDLAYNKKLMNNESFREVCLAGRHYGVTLIITVQYLIDLSVSMRSNVDFAFFLSENNQKNREKIFLNYCSCFDELKLFNAVFTTCTENRGCFVVNRKSAVGTIEETVSWYKADHTIQFKYGSPELWSFNKRRYLSDEEKYLMKQQRELETNENGQEHDLTKTKRTSLIRITKN